MDTKEDNYFNLIEDLKCKGIGIFESLRDPHHVIDAIELLRNLQGEEKNKAKVEKIPDLSKDELMDQYMNSLYTLRDSSKAQYRVEAEKFLSYLLKNEIKIPDINIEIINKYISLRSIPDKKKKNAKKISANSQAKIVNILRRFLNFLMDKGFIRIDIKKIKAPKRVKSPRGIVTRDDLYKLINCLNKRTEKFRNENLTYKVIVYLLIDTGMRRSELVNLNWENIDFTNNNINLKDTKGGESNEIKFGNNLRELLLTYRKALRISKGAVVRGVQGRKRINKNSLQNIKDKLFKEAKIDRPGLCLHSFRHGCATMVCNAAGIKAAQEKLGHSRIDTTEVYIHPTDEEMNKAIIDIPLQMSSFDEKS